MNVSKHPSWSQVTLTEEKPVDGIDFTLTPQEKDIAVLAMTEILAKQRFGQFTPGLVARELQASDLTESERVEFGLGMRA